MLKTCLLLFLLAWAHLPAFAQLPQRLTRAESFFGLHFDKHSGRDDRNLGLTLTEGMIDSLLTAVKPDYIQVDTKGHPGITSYPSRFGTSAASFEKDPLDLLRRVTARHGVALYSHYSGVLDRQAVIEHPGWAVIDADGSRNERATSFYSPYVDSLMLPQLKELSEYGIDGVWVDGECWGTVPDYGEEARQEFRQRTGLEPPDGPDHANSKAYLEFFRSKFREHVAYYVNAMDRYDPNFQIASNWAYSSMMPEPIHIDVDFLSGDVAALNTVYSAAFEARCLAPQGRMYEKPWDLMAWSFTWNGEAPVRLRTTKSAVHVKQEAAQVMAMGGGFQLYLKQNADMSIQPWTIPLAADIARFVRARQPYVQGATAVPQIALLLSSEGVQAVSNGVYRGWGGHLDPIEGMTEALLDGQHPFEILMTHHLRGRTAEYPLIIIPEWKRLEDDLREELVEYVRDGGRLLVIGAETTRSFTDVLGVNPQGEPNNTFHFIGFDGRLAAVHSPYQPVEALPGTRVVASTYSTNDFRYPTGIAATIRRIGDGEIAGLYADFGQYYQAGGAPLHRDLLTGLVRRLFPDPRVRVEGSNLVHLTLNRLGDALTVNLINAGGQHADPTVSTYDELPPVGPLTVRIAVNAEPSSVHLQPGDEEPEYTYRNGTLTVTVPRLEVHRIIVVQ